MKQVEGLDNSGVESAFSSFFNRAINMKSKELSTIVKEAIIGPKKQKNIRE